MEQKIGKHRASRAGRSLGELEAIVVNIFDSLAGGSAQAASTGLRGSQRLKTGAKSSWRIEEEPREPGEVWQEPVSPTPACHRPPRQPRSASAPAERTEMPVHDHDHDHDHDSGPGTGEDRGYLLNEEEDQFVEQTVAWLSSRANPDILLDCIWTRLVDLPEEQEADLPGNKNPVQEPDTNQGEEESG